MRKFICTRRGSIYRADCRMRKLICTRRGSVYCADCRDPYGSLDRRDIMALQQLPGSLVLNVFIKNTFIVVPLQGAEARAGAEARRCKSAPPKMLSPPDEKPDEAETNGHITAQDNEMVEQVVEEGSEASESGAAGEETTSEGDEDDGEKGPVVEYLTGYMPTRGPVASPQKLRPSVLLRQKERMVDRFLDEEISKVRAEKWDRLSKGLVELSTQKFSLNTVRSDMFVPKRRLVINKLVMMHVAQFTGLTSEINALKEKSILREKGVTMEIWVAKRDAQNQGLRKFLLAAVRFQKAFEDRQVLVQYRGFLPNLFLTESYTPVVPRKLAPDSSPRLHNLRARLVFSQKIYHCHAPLEHFMLLCPAFQPGLPDDAEPVQRIYSSTLGWRPSCDRFLFPWEQTRRG